jgi:hypothetical protein
MSRRDSRGELTPWSFFLPVALAVALGVVVADAVGFTTSAMVLKHEVAEASGPVSTAHPVGMPSAVTAKGSDGSASNTKVSAPAAKAKSVVAALPVLAPVRLPGPTSARRDGEIRACINGSIALRVAHGWQQEVLNDAPSRCQASSP